MGCHPPISGAVGNESGSILAFLSKIRATERAGRKPAKKVRRHDRTKWDSRIAKPRAQGNFRFRTHRAAESGWRPLGHRGSHAGQRLSARSEAFPAAQ